MADSFENGLRRAMTALGHVVERVIGEAKRAKVQVSSRGGMQPILSLESQLPFSRINDLIEASTEKIVSKIAPEVKGEAALEVGEGPIRYTAQFLSMQAAKAIGVEIGGASSGRQGDISRGYVVRGQISRLPFSNNSFAYIIARLATMFQGDMQRSMRELGRILAPAKQGVIIDYHPFGLYAKRGTNRMRSAESGVRKFEDYYRLCRNAGLRVVDVREAFVDEGMRSFFKDEEIQAYRNLKGTPLLVFLFVYKPRSSA